MRAPERDSVQYKVELNSFGQLVLNQSTHPSNPSSKSPILHMPGWQPKGEKRREDVEKGREL